MLLLDLWHCGGVVGYFLHGERGVAHVRGGMGSGLFEKKMLSGTTA